VPGGEQFRWIYANPRYRTPPAIVPACSYPRKTPWNGRLYLAPLDAVIAEDTLKYYNVSLVVNCLRMYSQNGVTQAQMRHYQARHYQAALLPHYR